MIQEIHTKEGKVMDNCLIGRKSEVWGEMEGVVCCGVDGKKQGKGKGRVCTSFVSSDIERHRETCIEWTHDSVGSWEDKNNQIYMGLCVSVNARSRMRSKEMEMKFWSDECTLRRNERGEHMSMIDHVAVDKKMRKNVLDVLQLHTK